MVEDIVKFYVRGYNIMKVACSNPYDKDKSFKKECGQTNSLGKYMSERKNTRRSKNTKHRYFYRITLNKEDVQKYERAFNARLAYEKNCILKYDCYDGVYRYSRPPIKGERMIDFAIKYNTTVGEMKACELQVDRALENES